MSLPKQEPLPIAPTPTEMANRTPQMVAEARTTTQEGLEALEVTQQPPATFYKDQTGRKATFELRVRRIRGCSKCKQQRMLSVQLLYENGKVVEKQELLLVASGLGLNRQDESSLAVRIAEVSKNHQNQRFRLKIALQRCDCGLTEFVLSDPVLVMSKKKKRPVKQETGSPAQPSKLKRARAAQDTPTKQSESDGSSQSSSTVSEQVTAVIAEVGKAMPPATSSKAPFTPDTPNLCLWANAAFDLLHKLQFQRASASSNEKPSSNFGDILSHALSRGFQCPSCHESYGDVPTHRDDCDLKLLLDQGEQSEAPAETASGHLPRQNSLRWSSDRQQFDWPEQPRTMYSGGCITPKVQDSPYNLTQDLLQLSEPGGGGAQPPNPDIRSAAADISSNFNLRSWKGYATLSKLLHSSTADTDPKTTPTGPGSAGMQWTGLLPPVGMLSSGLPSLSSALKTPPAKQNGTESMPFQRFSALLSATKFMSADTANLLREGEAALNGDGSIANSLSNLSLSDILRSSTGEFGSDLRLPNVSGSLSTLLAGDSPRVNTSSETAVHTIIASDFRECGFPAFDSSSQLLGFYCLLDATPDSPAELRFMPNLYALPDEMMKELTSTVADWRETPALVHTRAQSTPEALAQLKVTVLHHVT